MPNPRITVSVVSHGQNTLVNGLLGDLARHCTEDISIVLTENVPDAVSFAIEPFADRIQVIRNPEPRGFGANHNAAFALCRTPFYCVANPDIRFAANPFSTLVSSLDQERTGVVGPLVRDPTGAVEDSARRYPTPLSLIRKFFVAPRGPDYPTDRGPIEVDWVAGMFMLFEHAAYRALGGFDERYFLYYEDIDICRRMRLAGWRIVYDPRATVVHHARRTSHRDPRYARHHLRSVIRYFAGPRS